MFLSWILRDSCDFFRGTVRNFLFLITKKKERKISMDEYVYDKLDDWKMKVHRVIFYIPPEEIEKQRRIFINEYLKKND